MPELKTKQNDASVQKFIDSIDDETKRDDCYTLIKIMKDITSEDPKMWGPSIVGFGTYHYKYASGTQGDWMQTGFSPRKQSLTLYIMAGFDKYDELLEKLGKHKTGVSCLYLKKLSDIDENILKEMITRSIEDIKKRYS